MRDSAVSYVVGTILLVILAVWVYNDVIGPALIKNTEGTANRIKVLQ